MLITGQLLLPDTPRSVRIAPGWVRLEGGRIAEVRIGEIHRDADLGGPTHFVAPGLVDPHLHLPQIDAFGAYGMRLLEWLRDVIFPSESAWGDPDHAELRCDSALKQLWAVGTTGIFAYTSNHRESSRRALALCERYGMRAILGQPLSDFDIIDALKQPAARCLEDARLLLDQFPERPAEQSRVCAAVAPRFAPTSTPELLHGAGALAKEYNAFVASHLAENEPECARAVELHGGPDYTSVYHRARLLGPKAVFGHCIHLSPPERQLLAETGTVIAHCPTSNAFLRSGTMNRAQWLRDGLRVAVASDIAAGYDKSMIRTARAMLEVTMYVREGPLTAAEAWWQITAGNADLLGWSQCGRLHDGGEADVIVIEPFHAWLKTLDPLSDLLWSWDDRWLKATIINGRVVYRRA